MAARTAARTVLPLLLAPLLGVLHAQPTDGAETKCSMRTYVCTDGRTGEARVCITTVCVTDKGEIVSTNTIVLKEEQTGTTAEPKGKVKLRDMNVTKQADKASPQ